MVAYYGRCHDWRRCIGSSWFCRNQVCRTTYCGWWNPARYICTTNEFYERNKKFCIGRRLNKDEKRDILLNLAEEQFLKK